MRIDNAGHIYAVDSYDGGEPQQIVFMKREGDGYPFNIGHHAGTNCQEIIRVLIDRVKYLQRQIPCRENEDIVEMLRLALKFFEIRAAKRHGCEFVESVLDIEDEPHCATCGHVCCKHMAMTAQQDDRTPARIAQPRTIPNPRCCERCEGRGYLVADVEWEPYAVQCPACTPPAAPQPLAEGEK